jgi:transposase-like protein
MDLRLRIVRAVERGSSIRAAARRFAVSPSAAIKLTQRVRATGSAAPARYGRSGARPATGQTPVESSAARLPPTPLPSPPGCVASTPRAQQNQHPPRRTDVLNA